MKTYQFRVTGHSAIFEAELPKKPTYARISPHPRMTMRRVEKIFKRKMKADFKLDASQCE